MVGRNHYMALRDVLVAGNKTWEENQSVVEHLDFAFMLTLTGPRSGRVYTTLFFMKGGKLFSYGNRVPHQASAPGEAPAPDTLDLLRSVKVKATKTPLESTITVSSSSPYAGYLEYGTSKIRPRPFFNITIEREMPEIRSIYAEGIDRKEREKARALGGTG